MEKNRFKDRSRVLSLIFIVVVLIYVARLFTLQILEEKYKIGAESNAFLNKTIYPPRGLIYDRNDSLLVYNKPAYDIVFINREIQNLDTNSLCQDLNITKEQFVEKMAAVKDRRKNPGYSPLTPQIFLTQLEMKDIAVIQQSMYRYRGFSIQTRTLREYKYNAAAHVLGSIGEVSWNDIDRDPYYKQRDFSGRDGLEYTYEKELRGEKGVEVLLRDARGRIKGRYEDGAKDIKPKAGENLHTTLDINIQQLGEKLLSGKIGSVVAIEPKTGEILAMVSNPTYNPSLLVGRSRSKSYSTIVRDPLKPMLNRATQAQYSPGSTFKTFQAAVALQLGGINANSHFYCNGPNSRPIRCTHFHGTSIGLFNALEQSCNPYFWNTFKNTIEKNGYGKDNKKFRKSFEDWRELITEFGFGSKLEDTDLYQQSSGYIPTTKLYDKMYGKNRWNSLTIRSLAIGQGEVSVTPIQLANAVCVIANRGYYISPHLNRADSMLRRKHIVDIKKEYFDLVDEGMWRVNESGTARYYKVEGIESCGKTGTVDNNRGRPHAFYIGYAPRENPKIVVVAVIENVGFGSTWAAPVASLIMEQYLNKSMSRPEMVEEYSKRVTNERVKRY